MTTEEKAKRYDILQAAFEITKKVYKGRRDKARQKLADHEGTLIIAGYSKGQMDAYSDFIDSLEQWLEDKEV